VDDECNYTPITVRRDASIADNKLLPPRFNDLVGDLILKWVMTRAGQNHILTPYMTINLVVSLPKTPYTHRIHMVLANPGDD